MTWLIKRGRFEYVFAGSVVRLTDKWQYEWTDDQELAHRFSDRNQAANIVGHMPADEERVRVVRLRRRIRRGEP